MVLYSGLAGFTALLFGQYANTQRLEYVNQILRTAEVAETAFLRASQVSEEFVQEARNRHAAVKVASASVVATFTLQCGHVHEISIVKAREVEAPVPSPNQMRQKADRIARFVANGIPLELESIGGMSETFGDGSPDVVSFQFRGLHRGVSEFGAVQVRLLRKNNALDYLAFGFDLTPPLSVTPRLSLAAAQNLADEQFVLQFQPGPNSRRLSGKLALHTKQFTHGSPYLLNPDRPSLWSQQTYLYYKFLYFSDDFVSRRFPGRQNEGIFKVYVDALTGEVAACQEPIGLKMNAPAKRARNVPPTPNGELAVGKSTRNFSLSGLKWLPAPSFPAKRTLLTWKSGTALCKAVWDSKSRKLFATYPSGTYCAQVSLASGKKIDDWIQSARLSVSKRKIN